MRNDCPPPETEAHKAQREEFARWKMLGASGDGAYRKSLEAFYRAAGRNPPTPY